MTDSNNAPASAPTTPTCPECSFPHAKHTVPCVPLSGAPEGGETSGPLTHCRECGSSAWMVGLQSPDGSPFYCSVCKGYCDLDQRETIAMLFDGISVHVPSLSAPDRLREAAREIVRMLDARELTLRDGISPLAQREAVVALSEFRIAVAEPAS